MIRMGKGQQQQGKVLHLPPELDIIFYREQHADLSGMSDDQITVHWAAYGCREGRLASTGALRQGIVQCLVHENKILEIGPFSAPLVKGPNVMYFDVLDQEELRKRAGRIGYPKKDVPHIDFVSPVGDLGVVPECFSAVVSVHCIEHQPDLVRHLQQVSTILDDNGRYYLIIPDKRYCFDHFIPESSIAPVIEAFETTKTRHSIASIIEHRALTTHNDSERHWAGDHADLGYEESITERTDAAIQEYVAANGKYIDVHAWQFTPRSFRSLMKGLFDLSYTEFVVERVYETPRSNIEFTAVLRKRTQPIRKLRNDSKTVSRSL